MKTIFLREEAEDDKDDDMEGLPQAGILFLLTFGMGLNRFTNVQCTINCCLDGYSFIVKLCPFLFSQSTKWCVMGITNFGDARFVYSN